MIARADFDVAIVGAGPAGSSAAISCRKTGLTVLVLEGQSFPRFRPGECLHPGVETLLELLGIRNEIRRLPFLRFHGIWTAVGGKRDFVPFGGDSHGRWLGFQVERAQFDQALCERARAMGAIFLQPCFVREFHRRGSDWLLQTSQGQIRSRLLIDASGSTRPVARWLQFQSVAYSPKIIARYGYGLGDAPKRFALPCFQVSDSGWLWTARVGRGKYQWVRASWGTSEDSAPRVPDGLLHLKGISKSHGADVTWRILCYPATPRYFSVGDAAAVLDPSASHGVLGATGIMAGHLARPAVGSLKSSSQAERSYNQWIHRWFNKDVSRMRKIYPSLVASNVEPSGEQGGDALVGKLSRVGSSMVD
jgi:flavin-dependent dehydrogenase